MSETFVKQVYKAAHLKNNIKPLDIDYFKLTANRPSQISIQLWGYVTTIVTYPHVCNAGYNNTMVNDTFIVIGNMRHGTCLNLLNCWLLPRRCKLVGYLHRMECFLSRYMYIYSNSFNPCTVTTCICLSFSVDKCSHFVFITLGWVIHRNYSYWKG